MPTRTTNLHAMSASTPGRDQAVGRGNNLGVVSFDQLVRSGFTPPLIKRLVGDGDLVSVHNGVFRTAPTVMSTRRRLLAACLALGGVTAASDRAALWLWGLCDGEPPIEVTTACRREPIPTGAIVHVRADLTATQISVRKGVPVTSPARTLADVGSVVDRSTLTRAVSKALYLHLVRPHQIEAMIGVTRGAPSAGVAALAVVMDSLVLGV